VPYCSKSKDCIRLDDDSLKTIGCCLHVHLQKVHLAAQRSLFVVTAWLGEEGLQSMMSEYLQMDYVCHKVESRLVDRNSGRSLGD